MIEEEEKILEHAIDYYKIMYGHYDELVGNLSPLCWFPEEKVSQAESEELIKNFDMEEVKNAIFSLEKNTAPGRDHMLVEFYQMRWKVLKEDMMDMFAKFAEHNKDTSRLNYGTITLIPKIKEANKI